MDRYVAVPYEARFFIGAGFAYPAAQGVVTVAPDAAIGPDDGL